MRVAFHTLGCRSNYADTLELQAAVVAAAGIPCAAEDSPDVVVINSCTVTDEADAETLRSIRKLRAHNPQARIVVTGCMAEVSEERLVSTGLVDAVIGPGDKKQVLAKILTRTAGPDHRESLRVEAPTAASVRRTRRARGPQGYDLSGTFAPSHVGPGERLGEILTRSRFHLRIQEGCENSCTFCIIPGTRGALRSRELNDVMQDLEALAKRGFREVVLTGTHLGGWGAEWGRSPLELLESIAERCPPRLRVRLSSFDPNDLSPEIIDLLAKSDIFCNHLHICVQALSERILKRMNRRYSLGDAVELIEYTHSRYPRVTIGSDIITGFPGETREEVAEQLQLFDALPLSYLHVFPYSERQDTAAVRLDGHVEKRERKRRAARWRAEAGRRWTEHLERFVGAELEAVLEIGKPNSRGANSSGADCRSQEEPEELVGTSREFIGVSIPVSLATTTTLSTASVSSQFRAGEIVQVRALAVDSSGERLKCELLNQESLRLQ